MPACPRPPDSSDGMPLDPDVPGLDHCLGQEFESLRDCLKALTRGPWKFIQLRGDPVDSAESARDCIHSIHNQPVQVQDIDLLGTGESVAELIRTASEWVCAGRCHMRIRCRKRCKYELTLISPNGALMTKLDLWIQLSQLHHRRYQLTFTDCINNIPDTLPEHGVLRLPLDIELAIYLQHLICRRRDLNDRRVQSRLQKYIDQCQHVGMADLARELSNVRRSGAIPDELDQRSFRLIRQKCRPTKSPSRFRQLLQKLNDGRLMGPRRSSMVSFMGCDGVGKTTLANQLFSRFPESIRLLTGKHLYRKSLTYKLAIILLRPCLRTSRERFDELLSPLLYIRASISLRLRLLFSSRSRLTIIDRSLIDVLMVNRKTNTPAFHHCRWLTTFLGCRIPTIHFLVSEQQLPNRKQEVTREGHRIYDQQVRERFINQMPVDYIAFGNDLSEEQATGVLIRILTISSTWERRVQPASGAAAASGVRLMDRHPDSVEADPLLLPIVPRAKPESPDRDVLDKSRESAMSGGIARAMQPSSSPDDQRQFSDYSASG